MSYDVMAGTGSYNYTSNMGAFFRDFGVYPPDWDGVNRHQVAALIDAALVKIDAEGLDMLKAAYDSANGWGDVESAIGWLRTVRDACREEISDEIRVGW